MILICFDSHIFFDTKSPWGRKAGRGHTPWGGWSWDSRIRNRIPTDHSILIKNGYEFFLILVALKDSIKWRYVWGKMTCTEKFVFGKLRRRRMWDSKLLKRPIFNPRMSCSNNGTRKLQAVLEVRWHARTLMIDSSMKANQPFSEVAPYIAVLLRLPQSARVNQLLELIQGVTGYG